MRKILFLILTIICLGGMFLTSCGTPKTTTPPATATPTPMIYPITTITSTVSPSIKLSAIAMAPASPADLNAGTTQPFTATGTYSDSSKGRLFSVTWNSDNPNVATIDSNGLATGVGGGKANITATLSGITSPPVSLTVVGAPATAAPTTVSGITVYVSVSVDGELLVAAQPVTVTDMNVEAAIKAAHTAYYSGGEGGYTAGIDPTFNIYLISRCWGVQGTPFVILNGAPLGADPSVSPFVNTAPVVANDNVIICASSDPMNKPATPVSLTATLSGDAATLTAIAWTLDITTFTYSHAPLANANVVDPITGASLGNTDADGHITVTVPESGVIAINGLAAINVRASATT